MRIAYGLGYCKGENWRYAVTDDGHHTLTVDLTSARWIDCGFLVRLACVLDVHVQAGGDVVLKCETGDEFWGLSNASDAVRYASRLGLHRLLEDLGATHDLPAIREHPPQFRFVELQRFGPDQTADELMDVIDRRIGEWGDEYLRGELWAALYELGINIEEHARGTGYVMAQWIPAQEVLHFAAVADSGRGIRASLAGGGHFFESDLDAVRAAVTTRLSSKPKDGGFGLQSVTGVVTRQSGAISIQSASGAVVCSRDKTRDLNRGLWSGTVIEATFPWKGGRQ